MDDPDPCVLFEAMDVEENNGNEMVCFHGFLWLHHEIREGRKYGSMPTASKQEMKIGVPNSPEKET